MIHCFSQHVNVGRTEKQRQLDHGTLKSQWNSHRWKLLGGLVAPCGRVRQVSSQVLQTDTPEAVSKTLPHHAGMISMHSHLRKRNNIHKNIFSSCGKKGASITSAVDGVTWPSVWMINSFNIGLLYRSNTVLYQYRRNAFNLSVQNKKKLRTHLPAILCARRCYDIPHLSAKHTFPHTAQHAYTSSHDSMWINNPIKYDWGFFRLKAFTLSLSPPLSCSLRLAQNEVCTGSIYRQAIYGPDTLTHTNTPAHTQESTRRHS